MAKDCGWKGDEKQCAAQKTAIEATSAEMRSKNDLQAKVKALKTDFEVVIIGIDLSLPLSSPSLQLLLFNHFKKRRIIFLQERSTSVMSPSSSSKEKEMYQK